jgi:hypothetical protein
MLIPAVMFAFLAAAVVAFALFAWRARIVHAASRPAAEEGYAANLLNDRDFHSVAAYQRLCPDLGLGDDPAPKLRSVRLYYGLLELTGGLGDAVFWCKAAGSKAWTKDEMALCTRYATAILMRRVERNRLLAAELRYR